jgi:alpha-galactosidase
MDISEENMAMSVQLCERDIRENGLNLKIKATTDRCVALENADYVINTVRIGGIEAFRTDVEIPMKYGVNQCVGDTLCAGGIMYGQRGIAFMLDLCKDIREVASEKVLLLNYANPNAMMTWAANQYGKVNTIGLCHGVQGGHRLIADALGLPQEEVDIICAGINHQTWYISIKHKGKDMTPYLLNAMKNNKDYAVNEKVRIDMLERFGYFSTESNGHLSEYLAWYRKRPDEIEKWISDYSWANGEPGGYLRQVTERRNSYETEVPRMLSEAPNEFDYNKRSHEHGSWIIEGMETGNLYRGHFNVRNNGCITNLPEDAIVEVPGYVDYNGVNIPIVGDLPLGCAAVCNQSISVQRLAVEAAVHGDVQLLKQAMLMDPLTGAVLNPPEIWALTDEMLLAQEKWLPQYSEYIQTLKK